MNICLFAASSNSLDKIYYDEAARLGAEIGKRGWTLIYGGSDRGLMKACAEAVLANGGKLTGIAPEFFTDFGVLSNKCSEFIYTETMSERKQRMEDMADAFIVLPGGIGTFDEFFETLTLRQLGVHTKPIALVNTAGYYDLMVKMMEDSARRGFMSEKCLEIFSLCATPEEAAEYIEGAEIPKANGINLAGYSKRG